MAVPHPLTEPNRARLTRAFADVPRRDIAIDCVLQGTTGEVYVDDADDPTVYQLVVTDLFTYFAGDAASPAARAMVEALPGFRLIMAAAPGWFDLVRDVHGDRVREIDRYSFTSDHLDPAHLHALLDASPHRDAIQRIGEAHAAYWSADEEKRPYTYLGYESFADFITRGVAFGAFKDGEMIGAAWASLAHTSAIEVSIVVDQPYRQQGIATALAAALCAACLERGLDPHWDAANPESMKLALKLGYRFAGDYVALFLPREDA